MKINYDILKYDFSDSVISACFIIGAIHQSYKMPIATIWYTFQNNNTTICILDMYTTENAQKKGVMAWLFKQLIDSYPKIKKVVTDKGNKKSTKWLIKNGFHQDETKQWVYIK